MSTVRSSVAGLGRLLAVLLVVVPLSAAVSPADAQESDGRVLHIRADGQDRTSRVCESPAGTEQEPFGTFRVALRCLQPGDTLLVHEGTYWERMGFDVPESARGTADDPVLVTGAPGEGRPVIRGGLRIGQPDHWTIQDLEFTNDGEPYRESGFHPLKIVGGAGWTVQRVEVHDAPVTGLVRIEPLPDDVSGTPLSNWTIRDSCIHDTAHSGGGLYEDHNLYVWTGDGNTAGRIERNVIFGAPNGHNVKLGNRGGDEAGASDNVVVRFNTMSDAVQSVGLVGDTDGVLVERNLLTHVRQEKDFYPAVRGLYLSGTGNVARDNAWHGAAQPVLVFTDGSGTYGGTITDQDNVEVDPAFDAHRCGAFRPADATSQAYGVYATGAVPGPADATLVDRVAGGDRIATAVAISRATHSSADTVLLARADDYPDALASSALAGLVGGPVLLSSHDQVPDTVLAELDRLGAARVILLGGGAALSAGVDRQLQSAGLKTQRLSGGDRFETATLVADHVRDLEANGATPNLPSTTDEVILVEGSHPDPRRGWPDAASAGQLAAAAGVPVLLTTAGTLPPATRDWLASAKPDVVTIIGGHTAVSNDVVDAVAPLVGSVRRLSGGTRYETARAVATEVVGRSSSGDPRLRTFVASGQSFPDALTAGPASAAAGGVLLLSGGTTESNDLVYDFLAPVADDGLQVTVVGGTVAVPDTFERAWPYG